MCSFRDKIYLGFTSRYDCDAIKKNFFQILKEQEVKTEILKVEYPESVMTEAKGMPDIQNIYIPLHDRYRNGTWRGL